MRRLRLLIPLIAIVLTYAFAQHAFAAGSSTKSGTAPNIASAGVETQQGELTFSGPLSTTTVKNVSYSFAMHKQCVTNPLGGGGCLSYMNVMTEVYICGSSQIGVVYPESSRTVTDIRCTPKLTQLTGSTGAFNGMSINNTTRKLRLYYLFTAYGSGGFVPHLLGQPDSATVSW